MKKHAWKHSFIVNLFGLIIYALYLYGTVYHLRLEMPTYRFWTLYVEKISTFAFLVFVHNLFLFPYLLQKRQYWLYYASILLLIGGSVWVRLYYSSFIRQEESIAPFFRYVLGHSLDLVTGASVFFTYRYFQMRQEENERVLLNRDAELKYLKSQLDQHFIFNCLNLIYNEVKARGPQATFMIEQFSGLLRYHLSKNTEVVPLETEVNFITSYIYLQEHRLNDPSGIDFSVEGDVEGKHIFSFVLIPFIENAFKHGNVGEQNSWIEIRINMKGHVLLLHVENSFNPSSKTGSGSLKIGLRNVKKRLALLYPEHYLNIKSMDLTYQVELQINLQHT